MVEKYNLVSKELLRTSMVMALEEMMIDAVVAKDSIPPVYFQGPEIEADNYNYAIIVGKIKR